VSHSDLCGRCREQRRAHIDTVAGLLCPSMRFVPPAPALSETPGTAETCGECAYFVARGHGNGACQPNGITAGYVHATEPACSEPGPRRAPAAPSGAGDAGCAGEDHDATQIHDCPTKETR
jgi:hypothetical protein